MDEGYNFNPQMKNGQIIDDAIPGMFRAHKISDNE